NGKTLGIVGYGRIGAHVAGIARAIGMKVSAWSRSLDNDKAAATGIKFRLLDDLLAEADIVSVHTALNAETRGLIDARRLALMKPGAYLVNTARAAIVDQDALLDALESGKLAGAGLDVFDPEPLPQMHPFTGLSNVVMTPHIGWPTDDSYERFASAACDALADYLDSQRLA
ncbi:MAG: D-2-hydroxyacid dehydrogenase family protein, partial [Woeseiaceae bacterium]|nr:D-2-hydroxyacid dehydrogenase family protein [Woeseiaceae bacterium]